ncbi:MAG: penicillin-binding transpeptidase domain-containing protein, partial [Burkholderiaceae bacterium]
ETPDNGNLLAAVVVKASPSAVTVVRNDGEEIIIKGKDLSSVESGLKSNAQPKIRIRPGSVVRIVLNDDGKTWTLTQTPEVEGGLVSMHPRTGEITALVGGFDFSKNKFNHVTQSIRQPGSSFKPFIYSAAIEKGITPTTVVNDAPLFFSAEETGSEAWEPQNYDDKFDGPLTVRRALALSKNMVSIRVLQVVGTQNAQKWVTRFGFEAAKHPPYLTMALGAGSVNPLQMVVGYSVFANGGHLVSPKLIRTIRDQRKRVLFQATDTTLDSSNQVISARNAFMVGDLLNEVARSGTGARAQRELKRPDLFGKTGTTNDSQDAWFVGYQPSRAAAVWVGYDNPRKLGSRETGGGLSLPIWIDYMRVALEGTPIQMPVVPTGIFSSGGDWYFSDMGPDRSIRSLGMQDGTDGYGAINKGTAPESERATERSTILNLFRN